MSIPVDDVDALDFFNGDSFYAASLTRLSSFLIVYCSTFLVVNTDLMTPFSCSISSILRCSANFAKSLNYSLSISTELSDFTSYNSSNPLLVVMLS